MTSSISVTILGSTGTIGCNTLDVLSRHSDRFTVYALTANNDVEQLVKQCVTYKPKYAVMADTSAAEKLQTRLVKAGLSEITVLSGVSGLEAVASDSEVHYVMAAIVGAAGLAPTLAAVKSGKRVLLANKESLVMSGQLFMDAASDNGATILPIDSEHNAIWQCMPPVSDSMCSSDAINQEKYGISHILLTASGGPFRNTPLAKLPSVTPDQACTHPNWKMGRKISVDSATMMNKGLEVIEACWLFGLSADNVQIVIHPESIIHSMVAYTDGSVLAQMGNPDMRTPIAYGLAWPDRMAAGVEPLDLFTVAQLNFEKPDLNRFPCIELAYAAVKAGGTAAAILNAANEVAVAKFLENKINYIDIAKTVSATLEQVDYHTADSLQVILNDDAIARDFAESYIANIH